MGAFMGCFVGDVSMFGPYYKKEAIFPKFIIWKTKKNNSTQRERASSKFPLAQSLYSLFFNRWIIHLQALIYPPLSALYGRPLCEAFQLNFR